MRGECPSADEDCKYSPDCFTDTHHVYGRPKSGIAKRFANLPESKIDLCRNEHEELHATIGVEDLPSIDIMKQAIAEHRKQKE